MVYFSVLTSGGGLIATEVQDDNPTDQTKVYDLVGTDWIEQ